jgi:hypothetical protein
MDQSAQARYWKKKKLKNENKAKKEVTGDTISEVHKRQAH